MHSDVISTKKKTTTILGLCKTESCYNMSLVQDYESFTPFTRNRRKLKGLSPASKTDHANE